MQDIKNLIKEINNEFTEVVGGMFIKLESGEMFTQAEVQKYVQRKIEKFSSRYLMEIKKESVSNFDILPDQVLMNTRSTDQHKANKARNGKTFYQNGRDFNITYRKGLEVVELMLLEANEKLTYYTLRDHIQYPTNAIMFNGRTPTFKELEPIVSLKERTIRKCLKTLEEKGLIKLVQSGKRKAIYVNPTYYASGKELDNETLQMFGLVECDNEKVESYLEEYDSHLSKYDSH